MLDPEQHHRLRRFAQRRGESIGSLVRESVARYLTDIAVEDDPLFGLIGLADDRGPRPHGDVGIEHDAYAADLMADEIESEGSVAAPPPVDARANRGRRARTRTPRLG
jgi:hypothetical protein